MKWQRARCRIPEANVIGEAWVEVGPPSLEGGNEIDATGRRTGKALGVKRGYATNIATATGMQVYVDADSVELLPEFADAAAPVDLFEWIVANQDL